MRVAVGLRFSNTEQFGCFLQQMCSEGHDRHQPVQHLFYLNGVLPASALSGTPHDFAEH